MMLALLAAIFLTYYVQGGRKFRIASRKAFYQTLKERRVGPGSPLWIRQLAAQWWRHSITFTEEGGMTIRPTYPYRVWGSRWGKAGVVAGLAVATVAVSWWLGMPVPLVLGVTRTWDNGGGTGIWNSATNWSDDTLPVAADDVVFDATSTANCSVDIAVPALTSLSVNAGYTGTITVNLTQTATWGTTTVAAGTVNTNGNATIIGSFVQTGGTWTCGASTITDNGGYNRSGGTMNPNTGIWDFNGTGTIQGASVSATAEFGQVRLNSASSNVTLAVDVGSKEWRHTTSGGVLAGGGKTITLSGATGNTGMFILAAGTTISGVLDLVVSTAQGSHDARTYQNSGTGNVRNFTMNNGAGDSIRFATTAWVLDGTYTNTQGILNQNGISLTVTGAAAVNGGTLQTGGATATFNGSYTLGASGAMTNTTGIWDFNSTVVINASFTNAGTIRWGTTTKTIAASVTVTNTGTSEVEGGTWTGGSATTSILANSGTWTWATCTMGLLDIQFDFTTVGTLTFNDNMTVDAITVAASTGLTCSTAGKTITVNGAKDISVSGTLVSTGTSGSNVVWTGHRSFQIITTTIQTATFTTFSGLDTNVAWNNGTDLSIGTGAQLQLGTCTYTTVGMQATSGWISSITDQGTANAHVFYGILNASAPDASYEIANGDNVTIKNADAYSTSFNSVLTTDQDEYCLKVTINASTTLVINAGKVLTCGRIVQNGTLTNNGVIEGISFPASSAVVISSIQRTFWLNSQFLYSNPPQNADFYVGVT